MSYTFNKENITFRFSNKDLISKWLTAVIKKEQKSPADLNFIFCSDRYLLDMNKQYLQHDYYTDIITFDYSKGKQLSGDIYISIDRVKENSSTYQVGFQDELLRVMVHGVLHLCGYKDKTKAQAKLMREKEDYYLSLWLKSKMVPRGTIS